eukprot:m.5747 g.5747  ORF g.5747 m.5747 type:complete len:749 (+) comp2452_c0_seq2:55-2301(+)
MGCSVSVPAVEAKQPGHEEASCQGDGNTSHAAPSSDITHHTIVGNVSRPSAPNPKTASNSAQTRSTGDGKGGASDDGNDGSDGNDGNDRTNSINSCPSEPNSETPSGAASDHQQAQAVAMHGNFHAQRQPALEFSEALRATNTDSTEQGTRQGETDEAQVLPANQSPSLPPFSTAAETTTAEDHVSRTSAKLASNNGTSAECPTSNVSLPPTSPHEAACSPEMAIHTALVPTSPREAANDVETASNTANCRKQATPHEKACYDTQEDYHAALLKHARGQAQLDDMNYDNAFGGSKAEYQQEKDFEAVMLGPSTDEADSPFAMGPCVCRPADGEEHSDTCPGQWLRTMNQQNTCWLYVHTITHVVRGSRPPGVEAPTADDAALAEAETAEPDFDFAASSDNVCLCDLSALLQPLNGVGQTPLLLTESPDLHTKTLEHIRQVTHDKAIIVNTRPFVWPLRRTGIKFADHAETFRKQLITAMKEGRLLVIDMAERAPNFEDKLSSKYKELPLDMLHRGSRSWWSKVFVRAKGDGSPVCNDGFAIIVISSVCFARHKAELQDDLPLKWLAPQRVLAQRQIHPVPTKLVVKALAAALHQTTMPVLLLDPTGLAQAILQYQNSSLVDVSSEAEQATDALALSHRCRTQAVRALNTGHLLLVRVGKEPAADATVACADGKGDAIPLFASLALLHHGGDQQITLATRLFEPQDMEQGLVIVRPGFQAVVISSLGGDAVEQLGKRVPLRQYLCMVAT